MLAKYVKLQYIGIKHKTPSCNHWTFKYM